MRIAVVHNPAAGRGRAAALAASIMDAARAAGHEPSLHRAGNGDLTDVISSADIVALVGGDGTLHHLLPSLAGARAAVWMCPTGTENLFTRELGMTPRAMDLVHALERNEPRAMDLGVLSRAGAETPFAIMASLGPDASVVHRVAAARNGPISHATYLRPILDELRSPSLPPVRVTVDGRVLAETLRGIVIVANSRQYAMRADPARDADPFDGLLDVACLPARTAGGAALGLLRARLGASPPLGARGRSITIEPLDGDPRIQADGEALTIPGAGPLEFSLRPGALRVLLPARAQRNAPRPA